MFAVHISNLTELLTTLILKEANLYNLGMKMLDENYVEHKVKSPIRLHLVNLEHNPTRCLHLESYHLS